jgi:hypothetical protein
MERGLTYNAILAFDARNIEERTKSMGKRRSAVKMTDW